MSDGKFNQAQEEQAKKLRRLKPRKKGFLAEASGDRCCCGRHLCGDRRYRGVEG
ncbi:hypothetical protein JCM18909_1521 [Cutibacterium acnes JCM 18909]|nr:hypothetical protein JCM18909_1521 [Cutibacterium acnes JCM 18909]